MVQTERLILRRFQTDDAEAASYNSQRPVVAHFMSDMVLPDEASACNWIDWINGRFNTEEPFIAFAIELQETSACIGLIGLAPKQELDNEIEILFSIADEYHGKGYATEAGKAIIEWASKNCNIDYLVALVKLDNGASGKVIEKLGFQESEKRTIDYDGVPTVFSYYRLNKL